VAVELKARNTAAHYQIGHNMGHKGKLLIAHPSLKDGIFEKSVIYLYQNEKGGSIGLVVNKRTTYPFAGIMHRKHFEYSSDEPVYKGGPVSEHALTMLHTDDWYSANTMPCSAGVAISSDEFMLQKMAMGNEPTMWRVFSGMAAWGPGQLEQELARPNSWLLAELPDVRMLFSSEGEKQWMEAIELCSQQTINNFF
jgi:putative transcriptional regulator